MPIPSTIGRFKIEALLGSGGMGEVYRAFDPMLKRVVAIKTVRPDIDRPEYLERLIREAQACARLQHRNIVTVYEAGEVDGVVFIAMEMLKGASLEMVLRRGELTFHEKLQALEDILDALEHAHGEGVIHRDIKPSNVHRQADGSVKLLDFGLARNVRAETLTLAGTVMGTPEYASPEQLRGERVGHQSDVYSTGVLAYEMLSGRRPFQSGNDSIATVVLKVLSEPVGPMNSPWTTRFPEIEQIVTRAMQKATEARYQSAAEMRAAIGAFRVSARDQITALQLELNTDSEATLVVARDLVAKGFKVEAGTVLSDALQANPGANDVRTFLEELRTTQPTQPTRIGTPLTPVAESRLVDATSVATSTRGGRSPMKAWIVAAVLLAAVVIGVVVTNGRNNDSVGALSNTGADVAEQSSAGVAATTPPDDKAVARATVPKAEPPSEPRVDPHPATPTPQPPATITPGANAPSATARVLFTASDASASANTGLKYRLIQKFDTDERDADSETTFVSGDRLKFEFESNVDGYLYVVQQGSTGRWDVLFPSADINGGRNAIKRQQPHQLPEDGWFAMDDNPGTEQVFVIFSTEPLGQLPGFKAPVTKPESVQASVVEELQQSIKSRDLVFEKDRRTAPGGGIRQASYIVNRDELGKAVTTLIQLKHRAR